MHNKKKSIETPRTELLRMPSVVGKSAAIILLLGLAACAAGVKPAKSSRVPNPAVVVPATEATNKEQIANAAGPAHQPLIVQGTGKLFEVQAEQQPPTTPQHSDGFQLSFVDTEIGIVVSSVIGDGLGKSFIVDPQVKGVMTLQATRPLSRDEVLPSLEAALAIQGIALVDVDGVYHVVPSKEAPRRVAGLRAPGTKGQAGYGIQIVPVKYISAAEMEKVLQPFAHDGGILRIDDARNLLLLAGTSQQLASMLEVVRTFDVDWLAGMSFALFPVEYVDVKTLSEELETVFAGAKSPLGNVVRLVPMTRLNSLMVITHEPSYLKEVETWIKRLDIGVATPGRRIYVYDVQNGKADDLASSLNKIMSLTEEIASSTDSESAARSNYGTSGFGSSGMGAGGLGTNGFGGGGLGSVQPAAPRASIPRAPAATSTTSAPGSLKIVPNPENNALLVYATPSEFSVIETALKRLDVMPIQVMLEASLAEVTLNDDLRFGLQWSALGGDGPITLSDSSSGAVNQQFPGFSYLFTGRANIRAVLNAIETLTNVNVISSPKLLVLNNHEANLQIGDQVPITVQSSVGTLNTNAPIVNSVQLRDTGVILRVTPRANKSGLVLLEIAQEVSDVVPTTSSNIDSPTIQQRKISTSIAVRDGETIALGGLIRDSRTKSRGGIPFLRRLPLLGSLFGSTGNNNRRTELIVLVTPHVIRSSQDVAATMDELRSEFKKIKKVMPEWDKPAEKK